MAVLADFSGIVVDLRPMAGQAKGPRIGARALRTLGMTIRAFSPVNVSVVRVGWRRGVTGRAVGVGGMVRFMALRAIRLCAFAPLLVAGIAGQTAVPGVRERQVARAWCIPYR